MSHEVSVNGVCPKRILRTYVSFRLLTQGRDSKSSGQTLFQLRFLALRLCIQKFRSRRLWFSAKPFDTDATGQATFYC